MANGRRGWNLRGPDKPVVRGGAHPSWKGDAAGTNTKRARAQRLYPLSSCAHCGEPATDRHHRDGDTGNNDPSNVVCLCRHCHMAVFIATSASQRGPQPAKPCVVCEREMKPLRRGRCHACNEYFRRNGVERPYVDDGRKANAAQTPRGQGRLPGLGG